MRKPEPFWVRPWRRRPRACLIIPTYPDQAGGAPRSAGLLLRTVCQHQQNENC